METLELIEEINKLPIESKIQIVNTIVDSFGDIGSSNFVNFKEITQTHFATEAVLAKEWLSEVEEEAWKDL